MLRHLAEKEPEARLYTFLQDGEETKEELRRGALDRKARILGAKLQEMSLAGERAVLLYPPGTDYIAGFFGCLYGNVIAVPAYPPDPHRLERTLPRLLAIIKNCQAKLILTTQSILSMVGLILSEYPEFSQIQWLASDTLEEGYADAWKEPPLTGESLAFLQYTSGSTGIPRGVKLSHGNLVHNLALVHKGFGITSKEDVGIIWLPPYHDMGLIGGILVPLFDEFETFLMSPLHFLQKPFRWLKAFSKTERPVISGGPNFAFDLCVRKITPEQRDTLDLSHWKVAFTGAEPIKKDTLENFSKFFAPCGFKKTAFYPCYGLAEATLIVSGGTQGQGYRTLKEFDQGDPSRNGHSIPVGCGWSFSDQKIEIVDPETLSLAKDGEIGEIWVQGPSVAKGYWGHQEISDSTFNNFLQGSKEGPFLRTGDLGLLNQGELFVTGRLKDLIIIRGMNHYPQDIERTLESSHPAFRPGCGAAFSIPVDGEERLVLIQELTKESYQEENSLNFSEVVAKVRENISFHHDLTVFALALVAPSSIPKTSSGKISRYLCKLAFEEKSLKIVYLWEKFKEHGDQKETIAKKKAKVPKISSFLKEKDSLNREKLLALVPTQRRKAIENYLQSHIAHVIGVQTSHLSLDKPLIETGLDSLIILQIKHKLEDDLRVEILIPLIHGGATISSLSTNLCEQISPTGFFRRKKDLLKKIKLAKEV